MDRTLQDLKEPQRRCDGCGIAASDEHLRRRTLRLEMATRFRPVHIAVLLLLPAPPARIEQFPYFLAEGDDLSRRERFAFLAMLLAAAGIPAPESSAAEGALPLLQRAGIYITWAVECPLEEFGRTLTPSALAQEYGAEIVLRITRSYKPRCILPMGSLLEPLTSVLQSAGLAQHLVLDDGRPFEIPQAQEGRPFRVLQAAFSQAAAGVSR